MVANCFVFLLKILEISQKPPGGLYITARRLIHFACVFCVYGCSAWRWGPVPPGDSKPVSILGCF